MSIRFKEKGQTEAGLALGYTPRQSFLKIVLPQVVKSVMPVYQGEIISLLKGTSIVGYTAVADMTHSEQSGVAALDFMVEKLESTPLSEAQRSSLSAACAQVVEEPTGRGFRVKLVI